MTILNGCTYYDLCFVLQTILTPQNNFYTKLGQDCVGAGWSVDLFLFPNAYIDIASISEVCRLTGGNLYKYSYFQVSTTHIFQVQ